tara:strand:- start:1823 stop:3400 length:1578 start_codon:yes stop_codon:yes gene_type:complete
MALTDMGEQVNRMVDANRGNPGALQQKHALNKDLLSLLALQKLQSEKKAAENELAMSMKGTPGTILEQREEELTGRATKEVTEGVAGALNTKQNQQKNNLQRMVGANPQMTGIAGQPAPNMARMAGGGIVAFGNGGSIKASDEQLKLLRTSREVFEDLTDRGKRILLDTLNPASKFKADIAPQARENTLIREANRARREGGTNPFSQLYNYFAGSPEDMSKISAKADAGIKRSNLLRNIGTASGVAAADPNPNISFTTLNDADMGGTAAAAPVSGPRPAAPVKPTGIAAAPPAGPQGFAGQYKQGIANANTELGRSNMANMYKDLLAKRQAVNAKVANQQGNFFDRFAGAKSLTGAAVNKVNNRNRRNRDELKRADAEFDIAEKGMTADTAAAKAAMTAGSQYATGTTKETSDKLTRDIQVERNRIAGLAARAESSSAQAKVLTLASNNVANAYAKWQDQKRKALADAISLNTLTGEEYKARRNAILAPIIKAEKRAMAPLEEQLKNLFTANRASGFTTVNRPRS